MADTKASAFSENPTPASGDGFPLIGDYAGTASNEIVDFDNLQAVVLADAFVVDGTPTDGYVVTSDGGTPTWMPPSSGASTGTAVSSSGIPGITITANSTTHTKSTTPVQLIASTAHDAETLIVTNTNIIGSNGVDTSILVDIMVGASSAETVLIPNLQFGHANPRAGYEIPIAIPAGTRLSARAQAAVTSDTVDLLVRLKEAGDHSVAPTVCTAYGANTSTSAGVSLTNAAGVDTESAWTVLSASTGADMSRLVVGFSVPGSSGANGSGYVDIGYGADGAETVVAIDIPYETTSTETISWPLSTPWTVDIPAGSRLVARYRSSAVSAKPTVVVYGLD